MYPPGSGNPPNLMNVTPSCNSRGGVINFDCNKQIAGGICEVIIINKATQVTAWSDVINSYTNARSYEVSNLGNGVYTITADNGESSKSVDVTVSCVVSTAQLTLVNANGGNASTKTSKDATAIIDFSDSPASTPNKVETHLGDFIWIAAAEVAPGSFRATYAGLGFGLHTIYARDTLGQTTQYTFNTTYTKVYGCTNPKAQNYNPLATEDDDSCILPAPVAKPVFKVPLMNSLRFVEHVDLLNTAPSLDNRRYNNEEDWQGIFRPAYYQKVNRSDILITQFHSNYDNHICEIRDAQSDLVVLTMQADLKQQNIGVTKQYVGWLTAHAGSPGFSRLYFNGGELPISFVIGDIVEIINAIPASINNQYAITGSGFNPGESIPYLIINLAYPVTAPPTNRINAGVKSQYDVLPYNTYEFSPVWGNKPNGLYYAKITATSAKAGFGAVEYNSEFFALYPNHPGTTYVTYRNLDDDLDLVFTTGLLCGLRVESEYWQRVPGGTRKTDRKPNGALRKLQSLAIRKFKFNTFKLPPWLHEKLAFAFDMDYVALNGVEVQSEDGYSEPSYINRYALSNGSILLEQVDSFTDQNGTDLGDVNATGRFIFANGKFVKQ